jgi:hypothetical protein
LRLEAEKGIRLVALVALQGTVFSFKVVSRLDVIEGRLIYRPAD